MTRLFTPAEISRTDKQLTEENLWNNERYKTEWKYSINEMNHYSNVDRAKKKAVSQYMDYDNFHQMVLGADLKGMKMSDVLHIQPEKGIMNPISEITLNKSDKEAMFKNSFVTDDKKEILGYVPENAITWQKFKSDFKKFSDYKSKINYWEDNIVNKEKFKWLVGVPLLDADLFVDLIWNLGNGINDSDIGIDKKTFCVECLNVLGACEYFGKLKMFIGKKHKVVYEAIKNNEELIGIKGMKEIVDKIM